MLTEREEAVLQALADTTVAFHELPRCHPAETDEWRSSMHRLQDLVMMRAAVRAHPERFNHVDDFE